MIVFFHDNIIDVLSRKKQPKLLWAFPQLENTQIAQTLLRTVLLVLRFKEFTPPARALKQAMRRLLQTRHILLLYGTSSRLWSQVHLRILVLLQRTLLNV